MASLLTTGLDTGTAFAATHAGTTFTANIVDNTNTFQSGDALTATGAGNVLNADLGNSANFAILASTTGIQTVNITAEALANGGAATNNVSELPVQINALRMANVDHWGDVQSRADVVIENISLPNGNTSADVTSAVTFTMRDTQPGSINGTSASANASTTGPSLRAYFDPQALKTGSVAATAKVDVALMNTGPTATSATPLSSNLYTGFTVLNAGVAVQFNFRAADLAAIQAATLANNQAVVATAIKNAVADYNTAHSTNYTATDSATAWQPHNSVTGALETGSPVTVALAGATLAQGTWVIAGGSTPANYAIGNYQSPTPVAGSTDLITSNIIVDNVGQGGYPQFQQYAGSTEGAGGDIIIGSMATSGGVEQFNVDVQRTSWNNSLQTTNNVLQRVYINSDATLSPTTGGQGYAVGAEIVYGSNNMIDWATPGAFVGTNGLRDVQLVDATKFNGSLEIGEKIDYQAFANYLQDSNAIVPFSITLGNDTNGVVNPGMTAAFNSVNLAIDSAVAASGNFTETITGGTGNDMVNLSILNQAPIQNVASADTVLENNGQWIDNMTQLQNVVIDLTAGGNNTVQFNGGGAAQIHGGTGNDAYYIDNTGGTAPNSNEFVVNSTSYIKAAFVANAVQNIVDVTAAPTAVETQTGTPGVKGVATIGWVNAVANATAAPVTIVQDVAVNLPVVGTATDNTGEDLQGVQVIYQQAPLSPAPPVPGAALSTQAVAADVALASADYVANLGSQGLTADPASVSVNHGTVSTIPVPTGVGSSVVITWEQADGTPIGGVSHNATDVMVETITDSLGDVLTITMGNEYSVTQSANQFGQGVDTFTRTVTGATSWSLDGQTAGAGPFGLVTAPGNSPSIVGNSLIAGAPKGTELQTVTWTNLHGTGASESIGGITVTDNEVGGATTYSPSQIAALVTAGNGTYGNLVVTGVGAGVTTPFNTDWTPTNPYVALTVAGGATPQEPAGVLSVVNASTTATYTAAQVATDVALAEVGKAIPADLTITLPYGPASDIVTGTTTKGTVNVTLPYGAYTDVAAGTTEHMNGFAINNATLFNYTAAQVAADVAAAVAGTALPYPLLVNTVIGANGVALGTIATPTNDTTVDGFHVINTTGAALSVAQETNDVMLALQGVTTTGVLVTPVANNNLLTWGTPFAVYPGTSPLAGTATNGTTVNALNTTVSLDAYGNLTTNAASQGGAALHLFTGTGETVKVTFEGVSVTANIPTGIHSPAGTYTTTDVNNAILTAVNNDPTLSKLMHATEGSASGSVILSSLIDGQHVVSNSANGSPLIAFSHVGSPTVVTGTASGSYTPTMAAADSLALSQIGTVQQAVGDGVTTSATLGAPLNGADSGFVNNSNVTDTGSNGASNVIDLSSNNAAVTTPSYQGGSANTVSLTGTGTSVITNYKVANDTVTTVPAHGVVINSVNDTFQMTYFGSGDATNPGGLNVNAAWLHSIFSGVTAASGLDVGSSFATAIHVSGAATGAGIVVIENPVTNTTSVYETSNVAAPVSGGVGNNCTLEATLVGVMPAATAIHLV